MQLNLHQITMAYTTGWPRRVTRKVLQRIDLMVPPGSRIGISGPSGAGKTTLGRIMAGMLPPHAGQVLCDGMDLWRVARKRRKCYQRKIQMLFQHPESTFNPRWTIARSLSEPFALQKQRVSIPELYTLLKAVQVDPSVLNRHPQELSGGELQRVAIARLMALEPAVIILDEPTAMLDLLTQARMMQLLADYQRDTPVSYVLISHDPDVIHWFCESRYRLDAGELKYLEIC